MPSTAPSDSKAKSKARRIWLRDVVRRWQTATGEDFPPERLAKLADELDLREYPETLARVAEDWILLGAPSRFRRLTLAAFFPNAEELQSIDRDIHRELRMARAAGHADGYREGILRGIDLSESNTQHMALVAIAHDALDLAREKALVRARVATAIRLSDEAAVERRRAVLAERRARRLVDAHKCPVCRKAKPKRGTDDETYYEEGRTL